MPLSSSSHLLKQLHWLPIDWRIRFKLSTLTLKICIQVARNTSPIYCTSINPSRSMRSPIHSTINTSTSQLFLWLTRFPYFCTEKLEHFKFASHTPHLKAFCFRSVLLATCHQCALILLETSALYKLSTYLLTYMPLNVLYKRFQWLPFSSL